MNVSEITDDRLETIITLPSSFAAAEIQALARSEREHRRVVKAEPVAEATYPAQCECGHMYLEKYQFQKPLDSGVIGFCWCGFCRTRGNVYAPVGAAKPKPASVTITNPCGHGCNKVGIDCDNCADKPVKDNPQTAGEGAIAALTLADVPIGAVAVIRTAKAVWESLVVAKSAGYTFVGNSIKWPDTRIVERWYWPQDAVNRMREEK